MFRGLITWRDLKTPGREMEEAAARAENQPDRGGTDIRKDGNRAAVILKGLGGKENIITLDNCITRLRLEVRDVNAIDRELLLASGAKGVMKPGGNSVQVVIGLQVQQVAEDLKALMGGETEEEDS